MWTKPNWLLVSECLARRRKWRETGPPTASPSPTAVFARDANGDFIAEAAIEVRSADEARSTASRMEGQGKGAIAFARTGDPQLGEWDDAAILGRYGDVPDDLAATWVAPQFMTGSGLFRIAILERYRNAHPNAAADPVYPPIMVLCGGQRGNVVSTQ